ncbi:MAG: TolC family protein [Deltaproteobacteria bacterium]|nr:TolC family protein [Deltaproteobacteria bacterium]
MKTCRRIGIAAVVGLAALVGHGRADDAAAPAGAMSGDPNGRAIIDTETSARREAEFEETPYLPQVFAHQWAYRAPAIDTPDASIAETETARLTVAEAVHQALLHNPGIAAQRLTPLRQREDVRTAEAIFDPIISGAVNKDRRKAPNSSALAGVPISVQENVNFNASFAKTLRTGGDFRIDFTNNRFVSNARFQGLIPQYEPELLFSLNQPLLRNFGLNFAYLLVDVTKLQSEAAAWQYRADLANFVKRVIAGYWIVVYTRQNLAVQRESLALAHQTLRENQERVRVGLLAPVAVKEAESQAAAREQQVIVANNQLDNALRTLQQVVYLQKGAAFIPRPIEPIDDPRTTPVVVDAQAALNLALEQRPEVHAQTYDLKSKQVTARVRENQLLPRVDFVGNFGLNGLSGDAVSVVDPSTGQQVQTPYDGSYWEALDRLTSKKFYSYQAGVEVEIPIGNAAAKSEYAKAKIDVSQSELTRRQLFSTISLEVSTAVNDVVANIKRIEASRIARELAEENLRNQQKRLEVGIATTKDVLDFQDDLTQARGIELQAATDYNISLAELARAQGTLLDEYSVVVEIPGKRFTPWWARF